MSASLASSASTRGFDLLDRKTGAIVFLAFASAYFCSAMVRAITATLSPVLTQEFSLHARDLGLLAGAYFLGFAAVQLPLGNWLDRYGPKHVSLWFLSLAVLGCIAFSMASSLVSLMAARVLIGMGVGACLMAPLTGFRRWYDGATMLRANSWMLMTGSLGMLSSTLPVQLLLPLTGWRPLFWILAALMLLSMAALVWLIPHWQTSAAKVAGAAGPASATDAPASGYADVWRHPFFRKMLPIAFINYGGMVSIQTLWAGPWMIRVAGYSPLEAATGLFCLNACMLLAFLFWGFVSPRLARAGWSTPRLIVWVVPLSVTVLAFNAAMGSAVGWWGWALFCVASSGMALAQPAVGMAFAPSLAGRAMSAYNLAIFAGVFVMQWGIGLLIDVFGRAGLTEAGSFQAAMGVFLCCCIASYAYFLSVNADNSA